MDETQFRIFAFGKAQPYAQVMLLLLGIASLLLGLPLRAPFWFVIAALAGGYLDWMFSAFALRRAAMVCGWVGIICAVIAIAMLARVL